MMKFYAFEYWGGSHTTTGDPNRMTGRMSIAGELAIFENKKSRDDWASKSSKREIVSSTEARRLKQGMSINDYKEYVAYNTGNDG